MEVFEQNASDNKYLHRDFHISMNMLMEYIFERYGAKALTEYLETFSREFHKERKTLLKKRGLVSLKEYLEDIYNAEEWEVEISMTDGELILRQAACPGIKYIKEKGFAPIDRYIETYTTVYKELCRETPYEYEMMNFNEETGACTQVFRRRKS